MPFVMLLPWRHNGSFSCVYLARIMAGVDMVMAPDAEPF